MQINTSPINPYNAISSPDKRVSDKDQPNEAVSKDVAAKPDINELDFSLMTNAEIYDWMQSKHFAGELTPKDAWTIAYMMLDIPVGGLEEGQTMPIDDKKPVDFFAKVSDGIAWAKKEQDSETV